jgi:hypothetical protein
MNSRYLFETTLLDEQHDLAIGIASVGIDDLPTADLAGSPAELITVLALKTVGEVPRTHIADAVSAILATTSAEDAAAWLREPPNAVEVRVPQDLERLRSHPTFQLNAKYDQVDNALSTAPGSEPAPPKRSPKQPRRALAKSDPDAQGLLDFAETATKDGFVPFRKSPIEIYSIPDLLNLDEPLRAFIVTVQKNPLLLIWMPIGFMIWYPTKGAAQGIGEGLRGGLSGALKYRLLKLFGTPDDIIRRQMDDKDDNAGR